MFKYDEYPEIKKAYEEFNRLKDRCYALEKKIRPNDEASQTRCKEADDNLDAFTRNVFAPLIYNTLKDKKPKLYNRIKERFVKWDQVFPKELTASDAELNNDLLGLVLEIGYGDYWLPDEYYDDKQIDGYFPAPPTHTKPWNFGYDDSSAKSRKKKELTYFEYKDILNRTKHKFCTVRHGLALIIIGYCWIFISAILACFFMPDNQSDIVHYYVACGLLAFALLGVIYLIIAYSKKCANHITFNASGIYFKDKKYKWANTFLTLQCGGSGKLKSPRKYVVYFSDHYLTQEELQTRKIKWQGFYMEVDERRAFYLLSFYHKRTELLGNTDVDNAVTRMFKKNNELMSHWENVTFTSTTFTDLLDEREEFVFYYKDVAYEIVMGEEDLPSGHTLSLYLCGENKFINSFIDKDDFLQNGEIDGKKISDLIDEIEIEVM